MFQNLNIPQLTNNAFGGASSAVLHLFSPRLFSDQGKRPIAYKFDAKFVPEAIDAIAHKVSSQNGMRIESLTRNPNLMSAMVPTLTPDYMIKMDYIASRWTFMLIVNNDKTGVGGITRSMSDNLHLYYGYFLDEPINPLSHMGGMTINENAFVVITHKTIVNKSSSVNQFGQTTRLDTMADIDIIPALTMATLSDRETVIMRPEDLHSSASGGYNGEMVVMHDEARLLRNMGDSLDVNSRLSVPKTNIKKVLDSIADTQSSLQASSLEGMPVNLGQDSFNLLFNDNIRDNAGQVDMGLPTNLSITLGSIISRYNPRINRLDLPFQQPYDTQNQTYGSAKNVFSSMMATVLPAVMADFVLAQIMFRYDSHQDKMEIYGVAPITPMNEEELKVRVNSFIFRLKSEIFPILVMQHGHFNININCDCTSVTHVNLNFYDDSIVSKEVFEVPTLLGGLNNPLVGTCNMADANAKELASLVYCTQEDSRDTIPLGNYDASSYNRSLSLYDDQQQQTIDRSIFGKFENLNINQPNTNAPKDWGL